MIDDNMIQEYRQQRARRAYIICIMLFVSISIMNMLGGQEYQKQKSTYGQRISTQDLNNKSYIDLIQLLQLYDKNLVQSSNEVQYQYNTVPFILPTEIYAYNQNLKTQKNDGESKNNIQNGINDLENKESAKSKDEELSSNNDIQNNQKNQSNLNDDTNNLSNYTNPFLQQYDKYMTLQQKQQYLTNLDFLQKTLKQQQLTEKDLVYFLFKKLSQQNLLGFWENKFDVQNNNINNNNNLQFGSQNIFQFSSNQGLQNIQIQQILGAQQLETYFETYDGKYIDAQKLQFQIDIKPSLNSIHNIGEKKISLTNQIAFTKTNSYQETLDSYTCLGNIEIDFNFNSNDKILPFIFEKEFPHLGINIECQGKNFQIQIVMDKIGKNDFWFQALLYALLITVLAITQLYGVLKVLKNVINNPQESSRYSLKAIAAVFIWDGMFAGTHILFSIQNFDVFQYMMPPSVLLMVLWIIFERILMLQIWKLQNHAAIDNENMFRKEIMVFHLKIYFVMCLLIIWGQYIIFNDILLISINLITTLQICNTAIKGQQQVIDKYFIWYVVLPRSIIPLYLRGCPYNIFHLEPSFFVTFFIIVLLAIQIIVLHAQQYLGPRFFVPDCLQPNKYNYFLKIPLNQDIEQGIDSEFTEDCTICFNPLFQEPGIDMNSDNSQNNQFYRRLRRKKNQIMRTPCNHKFHILCLSNWMNIKMECPSCRSVLPPI